MLWQALLCSPQESEERIAPIPAKSISPTHGAFSRFFNGGTIASLRNPPLCKLPVFPRVGKKDTTFAAVRTGRTTLAKHPSRSGLAAALLSHKRLNSSFGCSVVFLEASPPAPQKSRDFCSLFTAHCRSTVKQKQ